jgi:hypothetical protein
MTVTDVDEQHTGAADELAAAATAPARWLLEMASVAVRAQAPHHRPRAEARGGPDRAARRERTVHL